MTGYGRAEGQHEGVSWVWEVRSVNGKSLDTRLRLPAGFESLESKIRKTIAKALKRGNLQVTLNMQTEHGASDYKINHDWLKKLISEGRDLSQTYGLTPVTIDGLFQSAGVIVEGSLQNAADPKLTLRNQVILVSLDDMLGVLINARCEEGKAMGEALSGCIADMKVLTARARIRESAIPKHIKQRLTEKIGELLGENMDKDRFAQEVALLAVKADVREELDRLDAHIQQAKSLLNSKEAIGRKLDFLSQEFIREINTLCAKSIDIDLTKIGLEMKSVIEQFREQAANIE